MNCSVTTPNTPQTNNRRRSPASSIHLISSFIGFAKNQTEELSILVSRLTHAESLEQTLSALLNHTFCVAGLGIRTLKDWIDNEGAAELPESQNLLKHFASSFTTIAVYNHNVWNQNRNYACPYPESDRIAVTAKINLIQEYLRPSLLELGNMFISDNVCSNTKRIASLTLKVLMESRTAVEHLNVCSNGGPIKIYGSLKGAYTNCPVIRHPSHYRSSHPNTSHRSIRPLPKRLADPLARAGRKKSKTSHGMKQSAEGFESSSSESMSSSSSTSTSSISSSLASSPPSSPVLPQRAPSSGGANFKDNGIQSSFSMEGGSRIMQRVQAQFVRQIAL